MSFLAGPPKKPQILGKSHYKDVWVRVAAVLCVASTLNIKTMEVDIDQAAVRFRQIWGGAAAQHVSESHKVFCKRHYSNFMENGNIDDQKRPGRPTDIDYWLGMPLNSSYSAVGRTHDLEVTGRGFDPS